MKILLFACLFLFARSLIVQGKIQSPRQFLSTFFYLIPKLGARVFLLYLPLAVLLLFLPNIGVSVMILAGVSLFDWFFGFTVPKTRSDLGLPEGLLTNLFGILGALSKADGRISEVEIQLAQQYMRVRLHLNNHQQTIAISAFREGAIKKDYLYRARKLASYFEDDPNAMLYTLQMIRELSLASGYVDPRNQRIVQEVCEVWGIKIPERAGEDSQYSQAADSETQGRRRPETQFNGDPFSYFDCTSQSSAKQLKSNYRELCKKHHPDRARAKAFHPDYVKHAEEKFKEIQARWGEVCKLRPDAA